MSEDRTQAPSNRRRDEARRRGHVARSPDLSAAAGLLAAVVALGTWGDDLAGNLQGLIRESFAATPSSMNAAMVVEFTRSAAMRVLVPLGSILASIFVSIIAAHQIQVGGLWAPSLLAPDLGRLWNGGTIAGLGNRAGRGLEALVKAALLGCLAFWLLRSELGRFENLSALKSLDLTTQASLIVFSCLRTLSISLLVLGVLDFWMQRQRYEAMLRMTPDQHREELRALDGDPALRTRRRRLAGLWRSDTSEMLVGATVGLSARGGLLVLVGGGPPPRPINVRHIARGAAAGVLRRQIDKAGITIVEAPEIARALARGRGVGAVLSADHAEELAALWPTPGSEAN
jgi:flagellar biosynthetic protein FlhB